MEEKNNKISLFQYVVLLSFLGGALYQGIVEVSLFVNAHQNAWLSAIIGVIIGIIPLLIMLFVINYEPEMDIIDKINHLFGPKIGAIINFVFSLLISILFTITLWLIVNFAEIKYLTETPPLFIGILFLTAVVYATIKGIEAISRSAEILFYINIVFNFIITASLNAHVEVDNLLPFINDGLWPVLRASFIFLSYVFTPFLLMTIIPKSNIQTKKRITKYVILGYLFSIGSLALVTFMVTTTIGANLAELYRFPSYYVMKKIQIRGFLENIENIFSLHWIFNMYMTLCMASLYLSTYINKIFKVKKRNLKIFVICAISFVAVVIREFALYSSVVSMIFVKKYYPIIISAGMFGILFIVAFKIHLNNKKTKLIS